MQFTKDETNSEKDLEISGFGTGYVESGTLGGSLQNPVFPSVFHYSSFMISDEKNTALIKEFNKVVNDYLDQSKVNNMVSLREYLLYLNDNNSEKIKEINTAQFNNKVKGSKNQTLPQLFFVKGKSEPLKVDLNIVQISSNSHEITNFLIKNGKSFNSEIPDEYIIKYYPEFKYYL